MPRALLICSLIAALSAALGAPAAFAEEESTNGRPQIARPDRIERIEGDVKERNFYEVLEDLFADFEYDIKNGNVVGLKDVSIRNIAISENIPLSFKNHLELILTEKITKNSKSRVIQCLPCKAKKTTLQGDQVMISSPENNAAELARIAKLAGIANFMDVAFSYQPAGLVLSSYIVEPESGVVVWSRSYNSETSRAAAYRKGVDFAQVDEARKQTEYTPIVQYRGTVYYTFEPNVGTTSGTLGFGFRMAERYDNRHKEVGFELNYLLTSSSIVGGASSSGTSTGTGATTNLYSGLNLTLLFVHLWNLIGTEENFNHVRGGVFVAVGGTYSSGYLGGLVRGGYEWRLGKHYAVTALGGYRPSATAFNTGSTTGTSVGGVEFGLGISMLF